MNGHTKLMLENVLSKFPQLEERTLFLTETHKIIISYLGTKRNPMRARKISKALNLDYNSTRARLSELMGMGYVWQPNKHVRKMGDLGSDGKDNLHTSVKVCGYSILKVQS